MLAWVGAQCPEQDHGAQHAGAIPNTPGGLTWRASAGRPLLGTDCTDFDGVIVISCGAVDKVIIHGNRHGAHDVGGKPKALSLLPLQPRQCFLLEASKQPIK